MRRDPVGPGQRSVWDFPRPPALEPCPRRLRVAFGGVTIADTVQGWCVLETSHPPVYYLPVADILPGTLHPAEGISYCEWKGAAAYFDVVAPDGSRAAQAAWSYGKPTSRFAPIAGHIAFYAGPMDACFVGDERVVPQPGGFYGGWITSDLAGPFKGGPDSWGW